MIPAILTASTLAGAAVGGAVAFLVHWEVFDFLVRHSRYRNHANGHLWSRT